MSLTPRHTALKLLQSGLLLAGMAGIGWIVVSAVAGPELSVAIVAGALGGLLLAPGIPKHVLLRAYGAKRLSGREFPDGVAVLTELARRAGLPRVPELYYIPSRLPNAFAMGRAEESVICLSDGMLRLVDRRELAGVLAHEVAHVANRDLWIMGLADAMSRAVSLASWLGQLLLLLNLPLILVGAAHVPWQVPLLLIVSPVIMALLQLALSRTREYAADRSGAQLAGDPEGLASALRKLERRAGHAWEEMFLPGRRTPEPSLLRTHPPTEERVRRLRALSPRRGPATPEGRVRLPRSAPVPPPRFGPWGVYR